ncbi:uncharacterized protein LOC142975350 [Anticarsia gemmatalis]|uniref:uncharacterized protein LOC142975350 n=1 Tax=Anticarsia gemmatalis TaxID=129554 RepID=UPI003F769DBF
MLARNVNLKDVLENCHFVPMSTMRKVIDLMETPLEFDPIQSYCKRNLVKVQQSKMSGNKYNIFCDRKFKTAYRMACCKAIYSHNWGRLLYLLKKCPPWEHDWKDINEAALYVRALLILLMYHPTSQAKGLLNEYLHLVWSCRSDGDKKAIQKVLLTLPEQLHGVIHGRYVDKEK